jgi:hypothetical protein
VFIGGIEFEKPTLSEPTIEEDKGSDDRVLRSHSLIKWKIEVLEQRMVELPGSKDAFVFSRLFSFIVGPVIAIPLLRVLVIQTLPLFPKPVGCSVVFIVVALCSHCCKPLFIDCDPRFSDLVM